LVNSPIGFGDLTNHISVKTVVGLLVNRAIYDRELLA
jgi:hypothetical protein